MLFGGASISVAYKCSCKNKKHKHCLSVLKAPKNQGLHLEETGTVFVFNEESIELILILFTETVSSGKKLPAALLVHLPHIGLLASVLCLIFIDQIHHKE